MVNFKVTCRKGVFKRIRVITELDGNESLMMFPVGSRFSVSLHLTNKGDQP